MTGAWAAAALLLALAGAVHAQDTPSVPPRLYRITIETGLPHLEESLRYATTHETRCLGGDQLADVFPILRHVAFAGCALGDARREGQREAKGEAKGEGQGDGQREGQRDGQADQLTFRLHCANGSETTGMAHWSIEPSRLTGMFEARLGAKNMTLYQRITAQAVGACEGRR